jgi:hypothetical protein
VIRSLLLVALLAALTAAPVAGAHEIAGAVPDIAGGSHPTLGHQPTAHIADVSYHGGPVLHWNRTHVIFWQPAGSGLSFDPGYATLIERFLGDVAADSHKTTNIYGLSGQYSDDRGPAAYNSRFAGAVLDTDPLPANGCAEPAMFGPGWSWCLNDQQFQAELEHVVHGDHLQATHNDIYFLVLPSGLGSCEFGGPDHCALGGPTVGSYCGYHSATLDGLPYAVIPYNAVSGHCQSNNPRPNASTADVALSTISHEQIEAITDPFGNSWIDESTSSEIADLCVGQFGPSLGGSGQAAYNEVIHGDRYYLQEAWSDQAGACEPRAQPDRVSFTAPVRLRARQPALFTARASAPQGSIVSYSWHFGDHRSDGSRRVRHTYKRPGRYRVVLRTTDSWGNWAYYAAVVNVARATS